MDGFQFSLLLFLVLTGSIAVWFIAFVVVPFFGIILGSLAVL